MIFRFASFLVFAVGLLQSSRADLIFDLRPAEITAGGRGYVDIYVSSFQPPNTSVESFHSVAGFNFQLKIKPQPNSLGQMPGGELIFQDTFAKNDPSSISRQTNSEQFMPNYIFASKADPDIFVASTEVGGDILNGADTTRDISAVRVGAMPLLMARVELAQRQPPQAAGDVYQIELVAAHTEFFDADINAVPLDFSRSSFALTTVTAVPEPSWVGLCWLALCSLALRRRRGQTQFSATSQ